MEDIFDWKQILFSDTTPVFLLEVIFRSAVMFLVALITLKLTGKRGIKQLSIFEVVIIISLGSAAGDPMFYKDVGLLPAIVVFVTVLVLYRLITWAISRFKRFENWVEGKPVYLIDDGEFAVANFKKEDMAIDEFYAELRLEHVEHLGQVKLAILETTGEISVFFFKDEDVKPGLPILPHEYHQRLTAIIKEDLYACNFCGNVLKIAATEKQICPKCQKQHWVKAIATKRIG